MIHKRTIEEVRRYDIFKLSIVLILLLLIFLMLLRDNEATTIANSGDETASSEVDQPPESGESGADTGADVSLSSRKRYV